MQERQEPCKEAKRELRIEINHGIGEKSEVIFSGDDKWMDLNKIYEEFAKGEGYRLEIYRN